MSWRWSGTNTTTGQLTGEPIRADANCAHSAILPAMLPAYTSECTTLSPATPTLPQLASSPPLALPAKPPEQSRILPLDLLATLQPLRDGGQQVPDARIQVVGAR